MGRLNALFVQNKIKKIEFYRSELFGENNEEEWCEIECQCKNTYKTTLYRKGHLAYISQLELEASPLWCFHYAQEQPIHTKFFSEKKVEVDHSTLPYRIVSRLIEHLDIMMEVKDIYSPTEPSSLYPERKNKSKTNKNHILIEYTNGTRDLIEMNLDSDFKMACVRGFCVIPVLYESFVGAYKLKKISLQNLDSSEMEEFEFMCSCCWDTKEEIEYITNRLFRDEKGTVYYTTPDLMGFFTLDNR